MRRTHTHTRWAVLIGVALAAGGCSRSSPASPATLKVAAASDLALVFPEIGALLEKETGTKVVFSFGSSGLLAKQVADGGPFDVYAAANVSFVDELIAKERCTADSRVLYGIGRVGVWSRDRELSLDDLAQPEVVKIAIPQPEHAPYGLAAKQALETRGAWEALRPKLVYGENARQAMQFAESGNVEAAFVPLSLAAASKVGHFVLIDAALHRPLEQGMAACGKNAALGAQFVALVMSDRGRAIMRKYGFLLPGETVSAEL